MLAYNDILCSCNGIAQSIYLMLIDFHLNTLLPSQFILVMSNSFNLFAGKASPRQRGNDKLRVLPYVRLSYPDNMFCSEVPSQRSSLNAKSVYVVLGLTSIVPYLVFPSGSTPGQTDHACPYACSAETVYLYAYTVHVSMRGRSVQRLFCSRTEYQKC